MQTSALVPASRRLPLACSSRTAASARRPPGRAAVRCLQGGTSPAAATAGEGSPPRKKSIEEITGGQPSAAEPGGAVGRQDPLADQPAPQGEGSAGAGGSAALGEHKKSIEEITAEQPSAAEPGGAVGRQDPLAGQPSPQTGGGSAAASGSGRELDVDAALRDAIRPLLQHTRRGLAQHPGDITPEVVASAAVASAEASGALPPLAGAQRAAVEGFFARLAAEMGQDSGSSAAAFEAFGSSGGEYGDKDAVLRVRPHTREILEAVVNAHLSNRGEPRRSSSPKDSVKTGGEVGNISLQSVTHGSAEPHGLPAESEVERAERQAEAQFQELVLMDLPHASTQDLEAQRVWEQAGPEGHAGNAAIEGDAPVAGGGLQVVDSPEEARTAGGGCGDSSNSEAESRA